MRWVWGIGSLAAATPAVACEASLPMSELAALATGFEDAFTDRDKARLQASGTALFASLPCLSEALVTPDAARLHRIAGMRAFVDGDRPGAVVALQAARHLAPDYVLDPTLVGPEHPLRLLYEGIVPEPPPTSHTLAAPAAGFVRVDGSQTAVRPLSRPAVFQRFDDQGRVLETAYLSVDDADPTYPTVLPRTRQPIELAVGAQGLVYPTPSAYGTVFGGVWAAVALPVAGPLAVEVGASVAFSPEVSGVESGVAVLPGASLGLRATPSGDGVRPWGSLAAVGLVNDDQRPFSPGGRVMAGVRGPVAGRSGWTAGLGAAVVAPQADAGVGVIGTLAVGWIGGF